MVDPICTRLSTVPLVRANIVIAKTTPAVVITLQFTPEAVAMEVKDNGSGLIAARVADTQEPHYGLLGMKERAKRIGGRVEISGPPGEGTTVRVSVPLQQPATESVPEPII